MKLHDAIHNDSELRDDITQLFEQERQAILARFESSNPGDAQNLGSLKAYLDALKQVRFLFLKGEQNARRRPG